ncbi:hypothetical protein R1sor_006090 [Riccia sorocarpa]|uniref:Thioredoxin domain-containing protein n=1 Tax=Riccia sorocarpa TaxID=122646 RepID=A0ABD3HPS4_9MARC
MAPVMILSSVSVPAAAYELGLGSKVSSRSSGVQFAQKSRSLVHRHDCRFLLDEKRIYSRFSSRALRARGGRLHLAGVSPVRAELAEDADKGNVIEVESAEEMARHLKESGDRMVVVNVSTKTCGPCKLIYPKVVKMSSEYPDVLFLKINGDIDNGTRTLMREWGVRAVPTFRFYLKGELIHKHSGAKEDELRAHFLTHYTDLVSVQ